MLPCVLLQAVVILGKTLWTCVEQSIEISRHWSSDWQSKDTSSAKTLSCYLHTVKYFDTDNITLIELTSLFIRQVTAKSFWAIDTAIVGFKWTKSEQMGHIPIALLKTFQISSQIPQPEGYSNLWQIFVLQDLLNFFQLIICSGKGQ